MKRILFLIFVLAMTLNPAIYAASTNGNTSKKTDVKIRITVGDKILTATMYDNSTTRDFISLLPFTVTLEDYARTEKISYLPKKLSTKGAPGGSDPSIGDIAYYSPWGNLTIYYRDFGYSGGLIKLGKLDSGIAPFNVDGSVKVTFELIK